MNDNYSIEELAAFGNKLSSQEALELEGRLELDPSDIETRVQLIGYYFNKTANTTDLTNRVNHIGWFVKNRPDHSILGTPFSLVDYRADGILAYEQIKSLWLDQIENRGQEIAILLTAAYFLFRAEPKLAKCYLLRASSLSPENTSAQIGLRILDSRND